MDSSSDGWHFGQLKWFDSEKGYGFINNWDDGQDYFIHVTNVESSSESLSDQFVVYKLRESNKKPGSIEAYKLFTLVDFNEDEKYLKDLYSKYSNEDLKNILYRKLSSKAILRAISDEIGKISTIDDEESFKRFKTIKQHLIPSTATDEFRKEVERLISSWATQIATNSYLIPLWKEGIILDSPSNEVIEKYFYGASNDDRINLFKRLNTDQKNRVLSSLIRKENPIDIIHFLADYIRGEYPGTTQQAKYKTLREEFWVKFESSSIYDESITTIKEALNEEQKFQLFLSGYTTHFPKEYFLDNLNTFNKELIEKVLSLEEFSQPELIQLFNTLADTDREVNIESGYSKYVWLYELAKKYLDENSISDFDQQTISNIETSIHYDLWVDGHTKTKPIEYLDDFISSNPSPIETIEIWIKNKLITLEEAVEFLKKSPTRFEEIENREEFYELEKFILKLEELGILKPPFKFDEKLEVYPFAILIFWLRGVDETKFQFDLFKDKFSFLKPADQILFLKKLFKWAHQDKFKLGVKHLDELITIDYDLYQLNQEYNPGIPLDISAHVAIEAIKSFNDNGKFLPESNILKITLENLRFDKQHKFKIHDLFEECRGRTEAKYNWRGQQGKIEKIRYGNNQFYFAIHLSPGERNYQGYFQPNPDFEELKEKIKRLPGRKWNPKDEHWGVPAKYEDQVLEFAKENRFFLDFEGYNKKNNTHFAHFERTEKPKGIQYCEGRLSKKVDHTHNKIFWWCCNKPCFSNCETFHSPEDWENYTLLDFMNILDFDMDDGNRVGDHVERGKYYQFVSTINRFNKLLNRLYCEECDQILYPVEDSHFAHYRVTRFWCENETCKEHHKEIYLHHCLNGRCNEIIDSRVSEQCPNGLYICSNEECGCCCSHSQFKRRYDNLGKTGGYIHNDLEMAVKNRIGHLERGEHFCYECGNKMEEVSNEYYRCNDCGIEYDLGENNFNRTHRHLAEN